LFREYMVWDRAMFSHDLYSETVFREGLVSELVMLRLRRDFYYRKVEGGCEQATDCEETLRWGSTITCSEMPCDPEVDVFCRSWTSHVDKRHDDQLRMGGQQRLLVVFGTVRSFMMAAYEFVDGHGQISPEVTIVTHGHFEMCDR
jgi:hypothetical protein